MRLREATWVSCFAALLAAGASCGKLAEDPDPVPPGDGGLRSIIEGWEPFPDYDPACGFFIPHEPLPPLHWVPCVEGTTKLPGPEGAVCRRTAFDDGAELTHYLPIADALADGRVVFLYSRMFGARTGNVVVEADGPVRQAILQNGPCSLEGRDIREGNFVFRVRDVAGELPGGAIGGSIDAPQPRVLRPKGASPEADHTFSIGARALLEDSVVDRLYDLDTGTLLETFTAPRVGGGAAEVDWTRFRFQGPDLFWNALAYPRQAVNVRAREADIRTLVDSVVVDADADAGSAMTVPMFFGTDGRDMVWLESTSTDGNWKNANVELWTAAYTTDPGQLQVRKRRVRSEIPPDSSTFGWGRFVVGCGYAARATADASGARGGVRIVRLTDGFSWDLFSSMESGRIPDVAFGTAHAITCDEVFVDLVRAVRGSTIHRSIARIRLDSLGPGNPPD